MWATSSRRRLALTATGVDFSNLALIAGALGLGIGLGLQSIVNNFVSGLIILAERPIRVGDWVSLPAGEGVVRRINVRSTEIETFDSCSIILPNSLLVTEPVRNWTHNDNMGRFLVAVTVDYDSDAELVRKPPARDGHAPTTKVLSTPEPTVAPRPLRHQRARFRAARLRGGHLRRRARSQATSASSCWRSSAKKALPLPSRLR